MAQKTKVMKRVENEQGEPLQTLLPRLINESGMTGAADALAVSKSTIGYWCLKLGIAVQRVALVPGEKVVIRKIAQR
jgi:hypothetical protein